MMDYKVIGEKIRMAREEKYLSQKEFAQKLGLGQPYISSFETGQRCPTVDMLEQICIILEKKFTYFLE